MIENINNFKALIFNKFDPGKILGNTLSKITHSSLKFLVKIFFAQIIVLNNEKRDGSKGKFLSIF